MSKPITCYIYRSQNKEDTYLYVIDKNNFTEVPADLLKVFGESEFCFELNVTPTRKLAKEDPAVVYENLVTQGFHLQLADDLLIEQQLALKSMN